MVGDILIVFTVQGLCTNNCTFVHLLASYFLTEYVRLKCSEVHINFGHMSYFYPVSKRRT